MAFVCVDKDGTERIFACSPKREGEIWKAPYYRVIPTAILEETAYVVLPSSSIRKLIGRELTWEDEPYELKEE